MSSPSPQRVEVDLAGKKFFFEINTNNYPDKELHGGLNYAPFFTKTRYQRPSGLGRP